MGRKTLVRPEIVFQTLLGFQGSGLWVHIFSLNRPLQPLHEDDVEVPSRPVHVDPHTVVLQGPGESPTGELTPLVGSKNLLMAFAHCLLQDLGIDAGFRGVGQSPSHQEPAPLIHHRHFAEEQQN